MSLFRTFNTALMVVTALWASVCVVLNGLVILASAVHVFGVVSAVNGTGLLNAAAVAGGGSDGTPDAIRTVASLLVQAVEPRTPAWLIGVLVSTLIGCVWFGLFPGGLPRKGRAGSGASGSGSDQPGRWRRWGVLALVVIGLNGLATGGTHVLSARYTNAVGPGTAEVVARLVSSGVLRSTTMPDGPSAREEYRGRRLDGDLFFGPPAETIAAVRWWTTRVGFALLGLMLLALAGGWHVSRSRSAFHDNPLPNRPT
ncbi:MAG: hypothetical protein IOD15_05595 [Phycisphaerales bacterium]|nr:hypothetical protein [Phycisphaerales bacterium]